MTTAMTATAFAAAVHPPAACAPPPLRSGNSARRGITDRSWNSSTANASRPGRVASCLRSAREASTSAVDDIASPKPATSAAPQERPNARPRRARTVPVTRTCAPPSPNTGRRRTQSRLGCNSRPTRNSSSTTPNSANSSVDSTSATMPRPQGPMSMPAPRYPSTAPSLRRWKSGTSSTAVSRKTAAGSRKCMARSERGDAPHYARATRRAENLRSLCRGQARGGGQHADRAQIVAVHGKAHRFVRSLQTGDVEEREVVLRGRHRQARIFAELREIDQGVVVARGQRLPNLLVEPDRPIEGLPAAAFHKTQVVHHVAAADDEGALVAQGSEPSAGVVVKSRALPAVDAQLNHRNVGLGVRVLEHRPGAVVEPPRFVQTDLERSEQLADPRRELRLSGRRVLNVEQRLGEAVEIVDRLGAAHRGHGGAFGVPVRRHAQDGLGSRNRLAEPPPDFRVLIVLQGVHRAAVPEEHHRHPGSLARRRHGAQARSNNRISASSPCSSRISGTPVILSASPASSAWPFAVSLP